MNFDNSFSKAICSICYEDLKPIVEDLQSISICGHVFHELCLQQWFEYCTNSTKKYKCPVCKQNCLGHNATRLYFQSVGDQSDSFCSQKLIDREDDAVVLRREVKRLLVKVSGLSSALERQEKEHTRISEELCLWKEEKQKETSLKNEALREEELFQQKLNSKSEELSKSKLECSRLEQRNMALAKEIAILKLVSNLELEQDEILELASLGNEGNSKDTMDNLIQSLASHKKIYKELMAKYNLLGKGEARLQKKLGKAKAKIDKLKTRIHEFKTSIEVKDNEVSRALKASKKTDRKGVILKAEDHSTSTVENSFKECQMQQPLLPLNNLEFSVRSSKDFPLKQNIHFGMPMVEYHSSEDSSSKFLDEERNHVLGEDADRHSSPDLKRRNVENIIRESPTSMLKSVSDVNEVAAACRTDSLVGFSGSRTCSSINKTATKPTFNIKTETPSSLPISEQENICFSGGLLGPDGTKRHLGKWCKRGKMLGSMPTQGSTEKSGNLIAFGADGRGGRVRVLQSVNQSSLDDDKDNSVSAKRLKFGAKTNSLQSEGCLQIEHFANAAY